MRRSVSGHASRSAGYSYERGSVAAHVPAGVRTRPWWRSAVPEPPGVSATGTYSPAWSQPARPSTLASSTAAARTDMLVCNVMHKWLVRQLTDVMPGWRAQAYKLSPRAAQSQWERSIANAPACAAMCLLRCNVCLLRCDVFVWSHHGSFSPGALTCLRFDSVSGRIG